MAPNLVGKYLDEAASAEPVQIISKQGLEPEVKLPAQTKKSDSAPKYKREIVWRNIFIFIYLHVTALYGLYYAIFLCQRRTIWWGILYSLVASQGVTSGAHRLWAHKTYKAKLPLRIFLAFLQTASLQNHIYEWSRDHRVHHKFTETDADPHNANRGFFFSHMGWLLVKKHKDVINKGKTVDMSDLEADPVVMFQKKFYLILAPVCCFLIPVVVPWYYWNEHIYYSWCYAGVLRYVISLHFTWLVNSAAHMYGTRPYDKNIKAVESKTVAILAVGEGWHNYHHVFPWDYKAAELGKYSMNFSTAFIDFFARIGWAYDLKTASVDMVKKRVKRTGDGSWQFIHLLDEKDGGTHVHSEQDNIWGWDDRDMDETEKKFVEIHNRA